MLKFSNFVMAKWWVFLLFGAVLLSAYAAIFGLYPDLLGWHFDKVLNVTTVTLLLALVVTALVYILNSDHKTKKKRTLWTVLFNIPLGVVGIGLVFLMAEGNPSPYRAAYSKQVKSICAVSESNVSDGEQYDAVLSDALEIANALSTTMDKYGRYDLFVDTDEKTGISRIEIQDSYSSCVSSELTGFDYTSRGRNGVSALTCEAGDGQSCLKQSKDIFTGYGYQEKDKDKVLGLVSKACDLEVQDSCFWLGIQYEGNHGFIYEDYFKENNPDLILFKSLKTDGTDAKRYFEKSCSLGNDIGCQFASLVDDRPRPG